MQTTRFREPSFEAPNEKRSIVRHEIGFYGNIVVGVVYAIPRAIIQERTLLDATLYATALVGCVREHPLLSATIEGASSTSPRFTRPSTIDLSKHVRFISSKGFRSDVSNEPAYLREAVEALHDGPKYQFADVASRAPWAVDVLPLAPNGAEYRVFISFTYSHSHGDGMSGLAFHSTFHRSLQEVLRSEIRRSVQIDSQDIPQALLDAPDTATNIPISWSYLLRPLLGTYLPSFVASGLGISADLSGNTERTWLGSRTFTDADTPGRHATTSVLLLEIDRDTTASVLAACRKNESKLTATLNFLLAQSLMETLASTGSVATHLTSVVPVNLRRALKAPENAIGSYAGAEFLAYDFGPGGMDAHSVDWSRIRSDGQELARTASNLQDQAIGLLRYVTNFRSWLLGKIGKRRDTSWELSNLGSFGLDASEARCEKCVFSQPATPYGHPLQFSAAGTRDGVLHVSITWQVGALSLSPNVGQSPKEQEWLFIDQLAGSLRARLESIGQA